MTNDHRSETVEEKSIVYMTPSIWGSGRAGTQFPSIAAFPRWSKMPSLPQCRTDDQTNKQVKIELVSQWALEVGDEQN